jgi:WD40 repeat protein
VAVGEGIAPFWITNELFGYIHTIKTGTEANRPTDHQQIVIASLSDLEPQSIIDTTDLNENLPADSPANPLLIRYALAHPTNENLLLVMASSQSSNGYLFQVNWPTKEVELLFPIDLSRGEHSLGFSPDGRFLVATGSSRDESTSPGTRPGVGSDLPFGTLHLHDLESGEHQTFLTNTQFFFPAFTFDWSLDGNWLAFTRDNNVITFLAPAYDYQKMIIHDEGNCTSLAWVNPLPSD